MSTKKFQSTETELLKKLRDKAQVREEESKRQRWIEMIKALPESTRDLPDLDVLPSKQFEAVAQKILEQGF